MTDTPPKIQTYAEFWPFYLRQHSQRATRQLHVVGTGLGIFLLILGFLSMKPLVIILGLIIGYGIAWFAHLTVEKNKPATFTYPAWSLRADVEMLCLWACGRLENELVKYQIYS